MSIGHWEFMFVRSRYQTANMGQQGGLLIEVADLVDAGLIRSTVRTNVGPIPRNRVIHFFKKRLPCAIYFVEHRLRVGNPLIAGGFEIVILRNEDGSHQLGF